MSLPENLNAEEAVKQGSKLLEMIREFTVSSIFPVVSRLVLAIIVFFVAKFLIKKLLKLFRKMFEKS